MAETKEQGLATEVEREQPGREMLKEEMKHAMEEPEPHRREFEPQKGKEEEGQEEEPSSSVKKDLPPVHKEERERQAGGEEKLPGSMKAVLLTEFGKPLKTQDDVQVPEPGPGEVLIRVTFCGVCHTDLHMRNGDLSFKPTLPQILGHEGVGKVCKTGPGVDRVKVGDRVLCGCLGDACGSCEACWDGQETACECVELNGCTRDGHLAQFVKAKEAYVCPIPKELSDEEAAPINCAGVTTFKALKASGLWCGQWLAVVGAAGGLGYYAVQYARAMGLKVIAVDKGQEKMDFLHQFPGVHCLDCDEGDIVKKIMDITCDEGVHAALILAPEKEVFEQAPRYLRKRGRLVVVGQPPSSEPVEFDMVSLVVNCHTVVGSLTGTRTDLKQALQLVADGTVKSEVTVREMDEVNDILDELAAKKVTGRNVVRIPNPTAAEE